GILVGLIQGSVEAARTQYTSDVIISTLPDKAYIENSPNIISLLNSLPETESLSARYLEGVTLEANYKTRKETDKPNIAAANIIGINPEAEDTVTGLSNLIAEGSYLSSGDFDQVIVGQYLLKQYVPFDSPGFLALDNVEVGTKIRIKLGDVTREVIVKGILVSKVDEVTRNVYMVDNQLRNIIGRSDGNVDQVVVKLKPGADPIVVRETLKLRGVDDYAKVQTYADAQPQFLKDIITTFSMLGNVFSSIGLIVSSVTIFIVIFINAITRRKFIGILKGIGINGQAIEISYIFQSIFYAVLGSAIGLSILYGFLSPFIAAHPIDFPFSDGILVAPLGTTLFRVGLLVVSTLIAGYIPARMIVRRNTLDSILGRNTKQK
ncbi:MAG TPA: FtsX-like permease family protein, partial [Candidatus Nanoarchaeia archaeon]|nr:FtsX-like permease family protein [Candidatus Nanoarchaeia archaeon]